MMADNDSYNIGFEYISDTAATLAALQAVCLG